MEAILSREAGGYDLYRINEEGKRVTFASTQDYKQKLSLKNCEAIANGYDLDELVKTTFPSLENCGVYLWMSETDRNRQRSAFIKGFQKALEILGDKKFSEEDILDAWEDGATNNHPLTKSKKENLLKSLQQTEWDCIIEMEGFVDEEGIYCGERPKIDADGCIILKRK